MSPRQGRPDDLQSVFERAAAGEDGAYGELISLTSDRLRKLTRKMFHTDDRLRRWEQTDDILQESTLRLYQSLAAARPESLREFLSLAATQVRRTLIDLARHHYGPEGSAAHHHSDGGRSHEQQPAWQQAASPGAQPDSLLAWSQFHEIIDSLPEEEREAFGLSWYAGLPQADIAVLLEVSIPTVKRRMQRARILINERMYGERPNSEDG